MVENDGSGLLLQEMRETPGYTLWLAEMKKQYLTIVRALMYGNCHTAEDLIKYRTSLIWINNAIVLTGMSKEEVEKWKEIR